MDDQGCHKLLNSVNKALIITHENHYNDAGKRKWLLQLHIISHVIVIPSLCTQYYGQLGTQYKVCKTAAYVAGSS